MNLAKWARLFPFAVDYEPCDECGGEMTTTHVRAPAIQNHWRGVEAWECQNCGHQVLKDDPDADVDGVAVDG